KEPAVYDRLKLSVEVRNQNDSVVYKTESIIKCINLENLNESIETIGNGIVQSPIISYEKEVKNNSIFQPTDLWEQMNAANKELVALRNCKKDDENLKDFVSPEWRAFCEKKYADQMGRFEDSNKGALDCALTRYGNDALREYVQFRYYNGTWPVLPEFSEETLEKNKDLRDFVSGKDKIYYQVYINLPIGATGTSEGIYGDGSIYVYVNGSGSNQSGWNARMFYDNTYGKWYIGGTQQKEIGFANSPWDREKAVTKWELLSQEMQAKYPLINEGVFDQIKAGQEKKEWSEIKK
ncbi:MAG: hypothetical protein RR614_00755, partial [Eubacterium sp.]